MPGENEKSEILQNLETSFSKLQSYINNQDALKSALKKYKKNGNYFDKTQDTNEISMFKSLAKDIKSLLTALDAAIQEYEESSLPQFNPRKRSRKIFETNEKTDKQSSAKEQVNINLNNFDWCEFAQVTIATYTLNIKDVFNMIEDVFFNKNTKSEQHNIDYHMNLLRKSDSMLVSLTTIRHLYNALYMKVYYFNMDKPQSNDEPPENQEEPDTEPPPTSLSFDVPPDEDKKPEPEPPPVPPDEDKKPEPPPVPPVEEEKLPLTARVISRALKVAGTTGAIQTGFGSTSSALKEGSISTKAAEIIKYTSEKIQRLHMSHVEDQRKHHARSFPSFPLRKYDPEDDADKEGLFSRRFACYTNGEHELGVKYKPEDNGAEIDALKITATDDKDNLTNFRAEILAKGLDNTDDALRIRRVSYEATAAAARKAGYSGAITVSAKTGELAIEMALFMITEGFSTTFEQRTQELVNEAIKDSKCKKLHEYILAYNNGNKILALADILEFFTTTAVEASSGLNKDMQDKLKARLAKHFDHVADKVLELSKTPKSRS